MKGYIEVVCEQGFVVTISVAHIESVAPLVAEEGKEEQMKASYPGCNAIVNTVRGHIIAKDTYGDILSKIADAHS